MTRSTARPNAAVRTALAVAVAVAGLCAGADAQEQPPWWNKAWRSRKLLKIGAKQDFPNAQAARAWVHVRQDADSGGGDLRVISPSGKSVEFGIVQSTADGRYLLGFQAVERDGFYAVYYDNPGARPVRGKLPEAGLIHYTMPIPRGLNPARLPLLLKAVDEAAGKYGADYWPRVYDAYNPFGPQANYVGVYRGYIYVPKGGRYRFATLSEHSSFLFVDDKIVVRVIGNQNIYATRHGQKSGVINLTIGRHPFLYVHFSPGRPRRCAAAWAPPGQQRFEIMPPSAFVGLLGAEVHETQRQGKSACADFEFEPDAYCETGAARMVRLRFVSRSSAAGDALINNYQWNFGDGQTSGDAQPRHVFLTLGMHEVRLDIRTTSGRRAACTKNVLVAPIWNDLDFRKPKLTSLWDDVKRYRFDTLPVPSLFAAWEFARTFEQNKEALAVLLELNKRRDELAAGQLFDVSLAIADYHHDNDLRPGGIKKAEEYLKAALASVPETDAARRYKARFALCDHYFYYADDPQRARQEYVKLRADFPAVDKTRNRVALIRIGDTYRSEGKLDDALGIYHQAEADETVTPTKPRAVVVGAIEHEVQSYMSRGAGDEALDRLEELLWYYPSMRLDGEPTLMRIKAALLKGDYREAKKHADIYIGFAGDRNWLPPIHIAAAEACVELGLKDEAVAHYRTVLEKFKEAPEVQAASNGLQRLGE